MIHLSTLELRTEGRGLYELTDEIAAIVEQSGVRDGLRSLFIRHTSASLLISENADREVLADLERFMQRPVVDGDPLFHHDAEGPDDMPAHIRSALTHTDLTLPLRKGRLDLDLGPWSELSRQHRGCS